MKCGETNTSNCSRRIIVTARSGNVFPRQTELLGAPFHAFFRRRLDTETEGFLKTWTEWLSLTQELEHSWHVMLNLKPPESSCACDVTVERTKRPRDDSDPCYVAWPSDTHRRLEVLETTRL